MTPYLLPTTADPKGLLNFTEMKEEIGHLEVRAWFLPLKMLWEFQ